MATKAKQDIAELIDQAATLAGQMAELKALDAQVRKLILEEMRRTGAENADGERAQAQLRRSTVAQVDDEPVFLKWALLKANRDVLKVGVEGDAWRARLQSGVAVPGVTSFVRETLYIVKQNKLEG